MVGVLREKEAEDGILNRPRTIRIALRSKFSDV